MDNILIRQQQWFSCIFTVMTVLVNGAKQYSLKGKTVNKVSHNGTNCKENYSGSKLLPENEIYNPESRFIFPNDDSE